MTKKREVHKHKFQWFSESATETVYKCGCGAVRRIPKKKERKE
jgi:hypothetical protein